MIISILIAIGLNFDTFSVAVVEGSQALKISVRDSLKVGILFGLGQALMALIGVFFGLGFKFFIVNVDHWLAFILLSFVGGKLIGEAQRNEDCVKQNSVLNFKNLFLLTVATSIDAVVVGITLVFINNQIISTVIIIGIITFFVSLTGYYFGKEFRKICKSRTKMMGGLILIIIGVKILIQHLFFGG
jgi:putative Mn2+ efflux pump MntP